MIKSNALSSTVFSWVLLLFFTSSVIVACGPTEETEDKDKEKTEKEKKDRDHKKDKGEPSETVHVEIIGKGNTMAEIRFDKTEIRVPKNADVHLVLINESEGDGMDHNFVLVKTEMKDEVVQAGLAAGPDNDFVPEEHKGMIAASPLAKPGETVEFTFRAPSKAGDYTFICLYPGHVQAMQGKFIVE